jgi:acetyl-CoA acetyltransferase
MARDVFLCDAVRTPIGRYAGALAKVRADDLAAIPIKALVARNPKINWEKLDEVYYGCANQAGEDNRNVARMALLLAGLPTRRGHPSCKARRPKLSPARRKSTTRRSAGVSSIR